MHNATPTGQAAFRLRFDAGSLMEGDAQQGLAHYLEHMAFNGSKRVAEGEMLKILERHGLAFGADTNASTTWTDTVYQLDVPKADNESLDTSLMLLRQVGSELTLAPEAIARERGVILSEERSRDTPNLHVFKANLGFLFKDQLPAKRLPIGKVDVIEKADQKELEDFYHHYYRPERAVLVAVGDFNVMAMEARIKARFSDWHPVGRPGPDPVPEAVKGRNLETRLVVEPGAGSSIQMSWVKSPEDALDSRAERKRNLTEQLGFAVLNRRLERLARADSPPFIGAYAASDEQFRAAKITNISLNAEPGQWRQALSAAEQEQRRIVQYGIRQDELDREVAETRSRLTAAATSTRRTTAIADDIVGTLYDREVFTSPTEDLTMFDQDAKGLTAERVNAALKASFMANGPLVFVSTPTPIEGGDQAIKTALLESQQVAVAAPDASEAKTWSYASFGTPGKVVDHTVVKEIGAEFVRFDNGVRLTVLPTTFIHDQILVRVRMGHGVLDLPRDKVTPIWAASGAFAEGGLKSLSAEEIERTLSSHIYGAQFSTDDDAFELQGRTRPQDFELQMQVLSAYLTSPGFRPEAFARMRTYGGTLQDQFEATPAGVVGRDLGSLMHPGDLRYAFPTRAQMAASHSDDFRATLTPLVAEGPTEIVIVGDITVDKAIAVTAATLGAMPARPEAKPAANATEVSFPKPTAEPITLTHKGRADQALAYIAWPATDFFANTQDARTLRVLAQVLELRLIEDLRETMGATYSPQAAATSSLTYPGYGYVFATAEVPPNKLPDFFTDADKIAAALSAAAPTADELERAKKPLIESLMKARQTNEYWLEQLSGAQADTRRLDAIRSVLPSLKRVTPADIQAAATTYLNAAKAFRLEVVPQDQAKTIASQ
jgi:zinc protease